MEAVATSMQVAAQNMMEAALTMQRGRGRGAQRGEAWHEKKRLRAERHKAGQQPASTVETPMCPFCGKNQPSKYCANGACRPCCENLARTGAECRYHDQ